KLAGLDLRPRARTTAAHNARLAAGSSDGVRRRAARSRQRTRHVADSRRDDGDDRFGRDALREIFPALLVRPPEEGADRRFQVALAIVHLGEAGLDHLGHVDAELTRRGAHAVADALPELADLVEHLVGKLAVFGPALVAAEPAALLLDLVDFLTTRAVRAELPVVARVLHYRIAVSPHAREAARAAQRGRGAIVEDRAERIVADHDRVEAQ